MSLSCEKYEIEQLSANECALRITYDNRARIELNLTFLEMLDTESLKKLMYYIQIELSNRQKEFDNEAHGSEQA